MLKRSILWVIYFLVCGAVVALAIMAGNKLDHCHECPGNHYVKAGM